MNRTAVSTTTLVDLPASCLWSSRSWPDFSRLAAPERHLALLPLFGFADWGLGRPLDLEETVGCGVLRAMLTSDRAPTASLTILPPLRFVLGPYPHTLFGLDFETAHELVAEIATSIKAAGLRRLVLFNSSPWNEEFAETCACDLRAGLGLQTFFIQLSSLGLDLHPTRSASRHAVQSAACALTRHLPTHDAPRADSRLSDFHPGDHRQPAPLPFRKSLDTAAAEGWTILAEAGERLAFLLRDIEAREPLTNDGAIPIKRPPPKKSTRAPRRRTP